jgi:hypothetical protein
LNDHCPKAEVVIIPPKITSPFQLMYAGVTANTKAYNFSLIFLHAVEAMGWDANQ